MSNIVPERYLDLLDRPIVVALATLLPNGQPQVHPVWCDRHGQQVWVNSAKGRQKDKNLRRRPEVTLLALDPDNPYRWLEIRGRVVEIVEGPAAEAHIEKLSHDYFGRPYTSRRPGEQRCLYKIEPQRVLAAGM